jgi:hypothetical protein
MKTFKREHLIIHTWDNCYEFWLDDIRGKETKERFESIDDLIDLLKTCYKSIKTIEIK